MADIVNFPTEIDYDCDEDNTKTIYTTSQGAVYMKTFIDNKECTAATDCLYDAKSLISGTQSVVTFKSVCEDSQFEEYVDDVSFFINT